MKITIERASILIMVSILITLVVQLKSLQNVVISQQALIGSQSKLVLRNSKAIEGNFEISSGYIEILQMIYGINKKTEGASDANTTKARG